MSTDGTSNMCSLVAGRTGTRCNVGRPQTRWEEGVSLANEVASARAISLRGNNAVSIGTRIRNALIKLSTTAQQAVSSQAQAE